MPLSEKWVVTLSTQYGCVRKCRCCDVPNIKFKGNATFEDLQTQLFNAISLFPNVKYTERLNIHFARMGEGILNEDVFRFSKWLAMEKCEFTRQTGLSVEVIHPVLTTSLPKTRIIKQRIFDWLRIKNFNYNGQAGLQLSINSTNEEQRKFIFGDDTFTLEEVSEIFTSARGQNCYEEAFPLLGRKICLNFAYATGNEVDADKLAKLFDPQYFMCKITPIHNNNACTENKIETVGGYDSWEPYQKVEEDLKKAGFDVLTFVPSFDEEEGLVTCGNLILGGSNLKQKIEKPKIQGI